MQRGGRVKRRGGGAPGCLDWLEGEAIFFKTTNRGGGEGHHFLGFARGLVCAFANSCFYEIN